LYYSRRFRWYKNCEGRELGPDSRLSSEPGAHLALVPRIIVQHDGENIQGEVSCNERKQRSKTSSRVKAVKGPDFRISQTRRYI
jgi:hypothetical protein